MALGDGTSWDETEPTESTEASLAPVYINDDRVGTRKRMQNEHFWPAAQTSVLQGGQHSYITLQAYSGFPGFIVNNSGTSLQVGGLWVDGTNNLWFTATGSTGPGTVPYILNGYCMISATDTAPNYLGLKTTAGISIIETTAGAGSTGGNKLGISGAFGGRSSAYAINQNYTALTDGIIVAFGRAATNNAANFSITVGGVTIAELLTSSGTTELGGTLTVPVKVGETWQVVAGGAQLFGNTIFFLPLGG